MGLLGVARANTAVGVSPETFLLLLLLLLLQKQRTTHLDWRGPEVFLGLLLQTTQIHGTDECTRSTNLHRVIIGA
jgi:hypothetical protein